MRLKYSKTCWCLSPPRGKQFWKKGWSHLFTWIACWLTARNSHPMMVLHGPQMAKLSFSKVPCFSASTVLILWTCTVLISMSWAVSDDLVGKTIVLLRICASGQQHWTADWAPIVLLPSFCHFQSSEELKLFWLEQMELVFSSFSSHCWCLWHSVCFQLLCWNNHTCPQMSKRIRIVIVVISNLPCQNCHLKQHQMIQGLDIECHVCCIVDGAWKGVSVHEINVMTGSIWSVCALLMTLTCSFSSTVSEIFSKLCLLIDPLVFEITNPIVPLAFKIVLQQIAPEVLGCTQQFTCSSHTHQNQLCNLLAVKAPHSNELSRLPKLKFCLKLGLFLTQTELNQIQFQLISDILHCFLDIGIARCFLCFLVLFNSWFHFCPTFCSHFALVWTPSFCNLVVHLCPLNFFWSVGDCILCLFQFLFLSPNLCKWLLLSSALWFNCIQIFVTVSQIFHWQCLWCNWLWKCFSLAQNLSNESSGNQLQSFKMTSPLLLQLVFHSFIGICLLTMQFNLFGSVESKIDNDDWSEKLSLEARCNTVFCTCTCTRMVACHGNTSLRQIIQLEKMSSIVLLSQNGAETCAQLTLRICFPDAFHCNEWMAVKRGSWLLCAKGLGHNWAAVDWEFHTRETRLSDCHCGHRILRLQFSTPSLWWQNWHQFQGALKTVCLMWVQEFSSQKIKQNCLRVTRIQSVDINLCKQSVHKLDKEMQDVSQCSFMVFWIWNGLARPSLNFSKRSSTVNPELDMTSSQPAHSQKINQLKILVILSLSSSLTPSTNSMWQSGFQTKDSVSCCLCCFCWPLNSLRFFNNINSLNGGRINIEFEWRNDCDVNNLLPTSAVLLMSKMSISNVSWNSWHCFDTVSRFKFLLLLHQLLLLHWLFMPMSFWLFLLFARPESNNNLQCDVPFLLFGMWLILKWIMTEGVWVNSRTSVFWTFCWTLPVQ